jgi:hypothetical protein
MSEHFALAAAIYDGAFAVFHIAFWRLFKWPASLGPSGYPNIGITQAMNIVLIYVFIAYAAITATQALGGSISPILLLIGAGFWLLRAVIQPILFGMKARVSNAFTVTFIIGLLLHGGAVLAA